MLCSMCVWHDSVDYFKQQKFTFIKISKVMSIQMPYSGRHGTARKELSHSNEENISVISFTP